ncbi:phosphatidylinositol glycan, class A [Cryptococcus wingfieldii CBS 7118]|uniref:phosphatidylinositol N-acetylglucosaminyltransferase n=1 Tax=Cryptococcus wingfieldii CBS 7118 TaxID=1295528 RepID=A0A1E3J541_9TREE|nr:phosphatidylinositol glycan, class A [Cryptococcus wingfieldii CBS 7118]ODN95236.1 phosphatidylinositol glycan, class A [Cryptococcus wingfieldii CBS 7118]
MALLYSLRMALYSLLLLTTSFIAVLIGVLCTLTRQRLNTNYYVARTFWHIAGPIIGWKFDVEGEDYLWSLSESEGGGKAGKEGRSMVMVGNHQSMVDILYLGRIFPKHAAIMAKESIKWIPGLGWFMLMSGTVFINRKNNKSAASIWIFPEGTRHNVPDPDLLNFKKGAFYLAVEAKVPIVPVVCENYNRLMDGETRFKRGTLRIKVLPPIPTTGLTSADVPALMTRTRELMLQTLKEISIPAPPSSSTGSSAASPTPLLGRPEQDREGHYGTGSPADPVGGEEDGEDAEDAVEDAVGEEEASKGERVVPLEDQKPNGGVAKRSKGGKKLAIAMVSDFFLPVVGGVETHIYMLSAELIKRGHKVIVITHSHPNRIGIHLLPPALKVFHTPIPPVTASQATQPNYLHLLPFFRSICISEGIDLVHGHGAMSSLGIEAILHAPLMGLKTCYTDHSLFGFQDWPGIVSNQLLVGGLRNVDQVICVSNTGRENMVLRAQLDPALISVVPNAIVPEQFKPDPSKADPDRITIVTIARLVHRKGIDLLISSCPSICALFPKAHFLIGGDGPKMVELLQMVEKHQLQSRVTLLGRVLPGEVEGVLRRGQIFLGTSLTEAFGISLIEAASCGLFVVGTKVGGVPEVLPNDMIEFCRADEDDVIRALTHAIKIISSPNRPDPFESHRRLAQMYSWSDVALRTEQVYYRAMARPERDVGERLARFLTVGPVYGPVMCCIAAVSAAWFSILAFWNPKARLERKTASL